MTFDPNEPRDEHGRWTGGALGIGKDIDHPNMMTLKGAVDRGAWNIKQTGVRADSFDKTISYTIEPKDVPAGWKSAERGSGDKVFYDPKYAHIDPEFGRPVPNSRDQGEFPQKAGEPGVLYRGMSYEEYTAAVHAGAFGSKGDYNIGDAQKGLTYFSTDPQQAVSYANGFAPWPYIAVPGRPAVVVAVKDPGGDHLVEPGRPTEIGVHGSVPTSAIKDVYFGKPYIMGPGHIEVRQAEGRPPTEGSRMSPSASIIWSRETPPTKDEPRPGPAVEVSDPKYAEDARRIGLAASDVATKLGFDPNKLTVTDAEHKFELNGTTRSAGGAYFPDKETITLYSKNITPSFIPGLVAHEIEHAKFDAFLKDYRADRDAMEKDPDYEASKPKWSAPTADGTITRIGDGTDAFMRPDGTLKDPYAARYPVYSAYTDAMKPETREFAKSDGVSNYSRDWWDAWQNSKASTDTALHETLAEIAKARFTGETVNHMMRVPAKDPTPDGPKSFMHLRKGIDPIWNKLYKAVDENWKRRNKK